MKRWSVLSPFLILFILAGTILPAGLARSAASGPRAEQPLTDDHLFLCEAVVTPTSDEFIEIANPTGVAFDLTNYFLSDDEDYALLPGTYGAGPAPSISSSDFIVQFPPGASIPAGGVVVVAFDGAGFETSFGFKADFEIHGTDAGTPDMVATNVGATAGLTNSGENAVLFYWDGTSDLVADADMLNIGTPSSTNDIANKTGVFVDGPDADIITSTYALDAFTMPQQASDPGYGYSTERVAYEAGNEATGGGNGITGDDETTENILITWDGSAGFTAPSPGACRAIQPDVEVTKEPSSLLAMPGDHLTYTVRYSNTGGVGAADVVITDELPQDTTYVSDDSGLPCPACAPGATGSFTWTAGTMAPGSDAFLLVIAISPTVDFGTVLTNTIEITTTDIEYSTTNNRHEVPIGISPLDLVVDKAGPEYAVIGEEIAYAITLQNQGVATATNVVLTDVLPISTTYLADDSGWACPACMPGATGPLTWTVGDIPSDTLHTFHLTVTVDPGATPGAALLNEAEASTDAVGDNPANNSAMWETEVYPLVTIHDVQFVPDPASDDGSPYEGQTVWVEGVVVAGTDEIGYADSNYVIEEPAGGPWSGLMVYNAGTFVDVYEGDFVRLLGEVDEYNGMTEFSIRYPPNAQQVISTGNPLPATEVITTALFATGAPTTSEAYESVLIEFQDAIVTDADLGYNEWAFDDGSGPTRADDFGNNDNNMTYLPTLGDHYIFIRGIGWYSYGDYKLEPRYNADVNVEISGLFLEKAAPTDVLVGESFEYALTVKNYLGFALTNVVVTDTVPANVEFSHALDGGQLMPGNVVSWTVASLPDVGTITFRFVVTATPGDEIWNEEYAVWAENYPTPVFGDPVYTAIGTHTPIYQIQGDGFESFYVGQRVKTRGVVSGFFEGNMPGGGRYDGFYIQDIAGDGNPDTSDGIYVNHSSLPVTVQIGHEVTVVGVVQEFNEYGDPCPECETQILVSDPSDISGGPNSLTVPKTVIDPPGDPVVSAAYFESLEGMFVTLPMTGAVVGPTNYGTIMVIPGDEGVSRVFRYTPQWGMPFGVRHYERYGDIGGQDAPGLIVGSVVTGTHGPLAYSYGNYIVATQEGFAWTAVYSAPLPITPTCPGPDGEQFNVLTFNVENYFDDIDDPGKSDPIEDPQDYELKRDKIALSIAQAGCPLVVGFQEVEKLEALQYVAEDLWATHGCSYTAYLEEGLDGRGIDVGYLTLNDRVTVEGIWQYQDCTTYDTGLGQGDCPAGQQRLYSRIPLVMTATIQVGSAPPGTSQVTFIVNHLKSKLSRAGDPESAMWRLLQAQSLAQLVDEMLTANPDLLLIVLGDLNDYEDAAPLQALYSTGGLTNTWFMLPPEARYSYIYKGVSQILDHVLVSPALLAWSPGLRALHLNADLPYAPYAYQRVFWGTSDHDPVMATFSWPPRWTVFLPIITRGFVP